MTILRLVLYALFSLTSVGIFTYLHTYHLQLIDHEHFLKSAVLMLVGSWSFKLQRVPALRAFWDLEKTVLHEIRVSGTVLHKPKNGVVETVLVIFV